MLALSNMSDTASIDRAPASSTSQLRRVNGVLVTVCARFCHHVMSSFLLVTHCRM